MFLKKLEHLKNIFLNIYIFLSFYHTNVYFSCHFWSKTNFPKNDLFLKKNLMPCGQMVKKIITSLTYFAAPPSGFFHLKRKHYDQTMDLKNYS